MAEGEHGLMDSNPLLRGFQIMFFQQALEFLDIRGFICLFNHMYDSFSIHRAKLAIL